MDLKAIEVANARLPATSDRAAAVKEQVISACRSALMRGVLSKMPEVLVFFDYQDVSRPTLCVSFNPPIATLMVRKPLSNYDNFEG